MKTEKQIKDKVEHLIDTLKVLMFGSQDFDKIKAQIDILFWVLKDKKED